MMSCNSCHSIETHKIKEDVYGFFIELEIELLDNYEI